MYAIPHTEHGLPDDRQKLARQLGQNHSDVFIAPEIRKAIYTTNTIESLNMTPRKVIKNRLLFPSDESVFKIMYLALRNISKKWKMPIQNWSGTMNQFAILFENRLPSNSFNNSSFTHNF